MLTSQNITYKLEKHGYKNSIVCLHGSLKSFGPIANGPNTIIDGFLNAGITVVVPAFYYNCEAPPPQENYFQNGIDYTHRKFIPICYNGGIEQIDKSMGAISKTMLSDKNAYRSSHPMCSFVAIGPSAKPLMQYQDNLDVYWAYRRILSDDKRSYIFHCGTSLSTCTPLHFAELLAGRNLFRRWALNHNRIEEIEVGGCSAGFKNFYPQVKHLETMLMLGKCKASIFVFDELITEAVRIMKSAPNVSRCKDSCLPCKDIIAGGPIFKNAD